MLRAAMPEAPVNEDGEASASEYDVGADGSVGSVKREIYAKAQASPMELGANGQLGATVASPVTTHALADLGAGWLGVGEGSHGEIQPWSAAFVCCAPGAEARCRAI